MNKRSAEGTVKGVSASCSSAPLQNTVDTFQWQFYLRTMISNIPFDLFQLELFCNITSAIERNALGNTLKDHIMSLGIVDKALEYITVS